MSHVVHASIGSQDFHTRIQVGPHALASDEPADLGGRDLGPKPDELAAAALGACTAITLRMYAGRKGWPLAGVDVALEVIEDGGKRSLRRRITFHGPLSAEQRTRLGQVADACPVHKMLTQGTAVETTVAP